MTREQKHKISRQIVQNIERCEYFRNAISKMKRYPKTFFECNVELRLVGSRNTIWCQLNIDESIAILKRKLKESESELNMIEKLIK